MPTVKISAEIIIATGTLQSFEMTHRGRELTIDVVDVCRRKMEDLQRAKNSMCHPITVRFEKTLRAHPFSCIWAQSSVHA